MRTGPELPGSRIRPGQATEEVSPRIPFDSEPRLFHPPGREIVGGVLGSAQAGAVRSLPASDLVQALEPLEDLLGAL